VVTFYGFDVSRLARDPFWTGHYPEAFANADLLVGISGHICERIEALGGDPDRIERWHLGVDLSRFPHRPPDPGDDPGTVRCLHVGRLVEKKAPLRLVRALRHAQDRLSTERRLHLTVAGDGPLRGALKREIDRLGLNDRVRLLGSVPHERVPGLMAEADLYTQHCVTAGDGEQEGQGVTFVEASATGRPVVATRHNGLPDVVLDGTTGRLVEPGDAEAMGAAIAAFARSPERRAEMGRAGRKHVEARFDLETQTRTMRGLYEKVTGA
jgi:colanic acid/amylovoran biosynthesis glycosyltransferase